MQNQIMKDLIDYARERMRTKNIYPWAAFIVKDGVVISKGYNDGLNNYSDRTTHGEMVAIKKAIKVLNSKDDDMLKGCEIYTTCEPCLACFETTLFSGIKTIVYSVGQRDFKHFFNDHSYSIDNYLADYPNKIKVIGNVLHDEGILLFNEAKEKYGW